MTVSKVVKPRDLETIQPHFWTDDEWKEYQEKAEALVALSKPPTASADTVAGLVDFCILLKSRIKRIEKAALLIKFSKSELQENGWYKFTDADRIKLGRAIAWKSSMIPNDPKWEEE